MSNFNRRSTRLNPGALGSSSDDVSAPTPARGMFGDPGTPSHGSSPGSAFEPDAPPSPAASPAGVPNFRGTHGYNALQQSIERLRGVLTEYDGIHTQLSSIATDIPNKCTSAAQIQGISRIVDGLISTSQNQKEKILGQIKSINDALNASSGQTGAGRHRGKHARRGTQHHRKRHGHGSSKTRRRSNRH